MPPEPVERSSATRHTGIRDVLVLIVCCALAAGLGETALRFALLPFRDLLGNRVHLNPEAVWMAPLTNLVLFGPVIALVALLMRRVRHGTLAYPAAVLTGGFLAGVTVAMITRRIDDWALAALALGLASQMARIAYTRPSLARRVVNASTAVLLLVCLVTTTVVLGRPALRERGLRAALPATAADTPNVLLLVLDTVRAMEMGLYGYPAPTTPNIDRWARRGVIFDRAFATAPWTLPSHASLFTGKWPHELGTGWTVPMPPDHLTLAKRLNEMGYATGGFAANIVYASWLFGLQHGFSHYRDYGRSRTEILGASSLGRWLLVRWNRWQGDYIMAGRAAAPEINRAFQEWRERVEPGRPWFAFLNYFDAHDPYDPVAPYDTMFPGTNERFRSLATLRKRPPEELRALRAAYDGAIASLDHDVGALLDDLERQGALRNTILIITSDHGEEFGEHGITGHGTSQYVPVLHVPLIVVLPDTAVAGRRIRRFVSLRDIPATIEDLVSSGGGRFPGTSLRALWEGDTLTTVSPIFSDVQRMAPLPGRYPIAHGDIQSLITEDRWHLIRPEGRPVELYDLATDSLERRDLAHEPSHTARVQAMTDSIVRLRGR